MQADRIYHVCARSVAHEALAQGGYRAPSLASEGFIHCAQAHQVRGVVQRYYAGQADLVVLVLDPGRLHAPLRYEAPSTALPRHSASVAPDRAELFPHIYGAMNAQAVLEMVDLAAFLALPIANPGAPGHAVREAADASGRRQFLAGTVWFTVPGTCAAIALAYAIAPAPSGLAEAVDRLVFTLRWLLVAFVPYAAVCLVILHRRFAEGAHNPLRHEGSARLQIHCRVMQNTLEQFAWFGFCLLGLASYLSPASMRLVPILCVVFAVARLVYWWGYLRKDTLGRAPGVQLSFTLNIALLVAVLFLAAREHLR